MIMDENTCMVDLAKYFLNFTREESCGKCVPCRLGTKRMLEILTRITEGKGVMEDLETMKGLGSMIKDASLCGLGQTAPNPVLTTLNYFYEEYRAHIEDRTCPAGVCKALIHYSIDPEKCKGCGSVPQVMPPEGGKREDKRAPTRLTWLSASSAAFVTPSVSSTPSRSAEE